VLKKEALPLTSSGLKGNVRAKIHAFSAKENASRKLCDQLLHRPILAAQPMDKSNSDAGLSL
jgi:hypothetical protein